MDVMIQSRLWSWIKPARPTRLQQEARIGLLFLSPWLIGFVLLKALPILAALVFSLTDFRMLAPEETKFIGLENYARFFSDSVAGARLFGSLGYMYSMRTSDTVSAASINFARHEVSLRFSFIY